MPLSDLPRDLDTIVTQFLKDQDIFIKSREGKAVIKQLENIRFPLKGTNDVNFNVDSKSESVAAAVTSWINRLPDGLVMHPNAPIVDLRTKSKKDAYIALSEGLQVLLEAANELLVGGTRSEEINIRTIFHAAFGTDPAAVSIRKPLVDPRMQWPEIPKGSDWPDINKLVRDGTLLELFRKFVLCGIAAGQERDWANHIQPIGQVTGITLLGRACAGEEITIEYAGFGASPPAPNTISDIVISLPTSTGDCEHVSITQVAGSKFFDPLTWKDTGSITVTLSNDVTTGCIGFFTLPPGLQNTEMCGPGDLVTAAGMVQSIFGAQCGTWGVMVGQSIVDTAMRIQGGRTSFLRLPCADCQANMQNRLTAGLPKINHFAVLESGPIHPRAFVTLEWSVVNADKVEIIPRSVAGSENSHELPPILGPLPFIGSKQVLVSCSRRWEAQYVLQASNANMCSPTAVEANVTLVSGYSDYKIGVSKVDITDRRAMLGMTGFAYKQQLTSGNVHLPQFARAFVVEENKAMNPTSVVFVICDIWTCTQAVKTAVVERLNTYYDLPRYTAENVMISGTHTHSGPGGYSEYYLYNLTLGGFDKNVFDKIVDGIVYSIITATINCKPGRIYVTRGDLSQCGSNRSFEAFQLNPEFSWSAYDQWTDRDMFMLKFVRDENNRGLTKPIGMLNWFALHPTSLGMYNTDVSGDNKGLAEKKFEDKIQERIAEKHFEFVAAFGNSNAGDVSGNVTLGFNGTKTVMMPLDGPNIPPLLSRDHARLEELARLQFEHALVLFDYATLEVKGAIDLRYTHIDMSNQNIIAQPGMRTWPAALGVSFGAGSSEDSIPYATIDLPGIGKTDINAGIIEGMTQVNMIAGGAVAWVDIALLAIQAPAIAAAIIATIITGTPISPALLPAVLTALPLFLIPGARSYVASKVAAMMFQDEIKAWEDENGTWKITVPSSSSLPGYIGGHGEKPIMFPVGLSTISFTPKPGSIMLPISNAPCPLVPHIVPIQLIRIGPVVIAGVPAEFTTMAGKRLKRRLTTVFGSPLTHVTISGYTNAYSGYVTTPEEYNAQHYEGASTLYGPHTLEAYIQNFETLAASMIGGASINVGAPFKLPGIFQKGNIILE